MYTVLINIKILFDLSLYAYQGHLSFICETSPYYSIILIKI